MKVPLRNGDVVCEGAVVVQDAKHRPIGAMRRQTPATRPARPAGAIDFADNATASQRPRLCDTDELVTEHAAESHVALDQLEVGLAHAGAQDPDQHLVRAWRGCRPPGNDSDLLVQNDCAHLRKPIRNGVPRPTFERRLVSNHGRPSCLS